MRANSSAFALGILAHRAWPDAEADDLDMLARLCWQVQVGVSGRYARDVCVLSRGTFVCCHRSDPWIAGTRTGRCSLSLGRWTGQLVKWQSKRIGAYLVLIFSQRRDNYSEPAAGTTHATDRAPGGRDRAANLQHYNTGKTR